MNDKLPKRKTNRLKEYDYSSNGCYFITVCTKDKKHLLAHYKNADCVGAGFHARPSELVVKTPLGYDVEKTIFHIAEHKDITIDNFIIMPNHIHLLITFDNDGIWDSGGRGNPPLQDIIGQLKSYTTKLYRDRLDDKTVLLWQRSYYDRIIRNETEFQNIWNYIEYNALKEYAGNGK